MSFLLTVDTEPDWGISGWRAVQEMLPRLLDVLDRRNARATFFVVGNALDGAAKALAEIGPEHEIGSHGLTHCMLDKLASDHVAIELSDSRKRLEDHFQRPIHGVRAPFFRTPPNWLDLVRDAGYSYESSAGRIRPSRMNVRSSQWRPFQERSVWRLPISTFRDGLTPFCLTYLRLLPEVFLRLVDPSAPMFYLHLHEFLEPRTAACLPLRTRLLLRRNAGEPAWRLLDEALDRIKEPLTTCRECIENARKQDSAADTPFRE